MVEKRWFFSVGRRQDGRYTRIGRLVLWWYGVSDGELCAVWWLDARRRTVKVGLMVKPPWSAPLYSEVHGNHRPYFRLFGWRVLSINHDR